MKTAWNYILVAAILSTRPRYKPPQWQLCPPPKPRLTKSWILGVIASAFGTRLGSVFAGFSPTVTALPIVGSFAISLVIGLISGSYPAYRAARPRPVEALRYE